MEKYSGSFTRRALMRQALDLGLIGSVGASWLAGCGTQVPSSGTIELKWQYESLDNDGSYRDLVALFNAEHHNNIRIRASEGSGDHHTLWYKLLANSAPDIFTIDVVWVNDLVIPAANKDKNHDSDDDKAKYPLLQPLCDWWSEQERQKYLSLPLKQATIDGRVYAAPFRTDLGLLYYRKDIVTSLWDPILHPKTWTWDKLVQLAQKALTNNPTITKGYLWQGAKNEALVCNFLELLTSYGAYHRDSTSTNPQPINLDDLSNLTSQEAIDALTMMVNSIEKYKISLDAVNDAELNDTTFWGQGKAAFMRNWPYAYPYSYAGDTSLRANFAVAPLPHGDKETHGHSCLGGQYLAINRSITDEKKEAAWKFIKWMMSEAVQRAAAHRNAWFTTHLSVYNNLDLQKRFPIFGMVNDKNDENRDILGLACLRPTSPYYQLISEAIWRNVGQAFDKKSKKKPLEVLKSLQQDLQEIQLLATFFSYF